MKNNKLVHCCMLLCRTQIPQMILATSTLYRKKLLKWSLVVTASGWQEKQPTFFHSCCGIDAENLTCYSALSLGQKTPLFKQLLGCNLTCKYQKKFFCSNMINNDQDKPTLHTPWNHRVSRWVTFLPCIVKQPPVSHHAFYLCKHHWQFFVTLMYNIKLSITVFTHSSLPADAHKHKIRHHIWRLVDESQLHMSMNLKYLFISEVNYLHDITL